MSDVEITEEEVLDAQTTLRKAIQAYVNRVVDPELILYDWVVVVSTTSVELEQSGFERNMTFSPLGEPRYKPVGLLRLAEARMLMR